jgi:Flp pilus assembly protein TadG
MNARLWTLRPSLRRACARLAGDRRGVAAVEFALLVPILMGMYFVTIEVAQAIDGNRKVGRIASMVGDLITQQPEITKSELEAIMKIGGSIIQPYSRSGATITVTAIQITANPDSKVQVAWSSKLAGGSYSKPFTTGSAATIPDALNVPGTFAIKVEADLSYLPMIAWGDGQKTALGLGGLFDDIKMKETYFLRPRMSTTIPCTSC